MTEKVRDDAFLIITFKDSVTAADIFDLALAILSIPDFAVGVGATFANRLTAMAGSAFDRKVGERLRAVRGAALRA
jgi:hypothetical protein